LEFASLSSGASFIGEPQLMGVRTTAAKTLPVDPVTGLLFVSPDYFSTLNIAFVAGRNFSSSEELLNGPAVAIVNQAFARKFFGDENPLGRKLTKLANDPAWTLVVGIVRDVKVNSLRVVAPPTIYIPYGRMTDWIPPQGQPGISMFLQVRGRQSVSSLTNALHPMFASRLAIGSVFRQEQLIGDTLVRERLLATVASVFAALAVLLAALGLYAIMSYAVMQRRQEIGVRMALGADPVSIQALILRDSTMVVSLGILVGLIVAVIASHWVRTLLYGLAPNDTATFLSSAALLVLIALLAAFIPAYRAAKADPMIALRHE
jgi:hypothetical protein